jgi:hypothetical protein
MVKVWFIFFSSTGIVLLISWKVYFSTFFSSVTLRKPELSSSYESKSFIAVYTISSLLAIK